MKLKVNLENCIMFLKGFCVFGGTLCISFSTSLAQWANTGEGPTTVCWMVIAGGSMGTALLALGGWLSNSFGNWLKNKTGIDMGNGKTDPKA